MENFIFCAVIKNSFVRIVLKAPAAKLFLSINICCNFLNKTMTQLQEQESLKTKCQNAQTSTKKLGSL